MIRMLLWMLTATLLCQIGCKTEEPVAPVVDPCLEFFDIEAPAGDWMWARGTAAVPQPDTHYRVRFSREGDTVKALYVHDLDRWEMTGTRREMDWMFTSDVLLSADEVEAFKKGNEDGERRLTTHAYLSIDKQCHVDWTDGYTTWVEGQESERTDGLGRKRLAPVSDSTVFSYAPCTEKLLAAEANNSARAAQKMVDEGVVPLLTGDSANLVAWTDAATDGDASCTFTFDYYWDGLQKKLGRTTAKVSGDHRKWTHHIDLSFIGSHDVTFERFRTCGEGERELIGTSCGLLQIQ
jgi:hypothetical protein